MPDAAIVQSLSTFDGLEPGSTASLAINLAYLALDRFRYKTLINDEADEQLLKCDLSDDQTKTMIQFRQLVYLSSKKNQDEHKKWTNGNPAPPGNLAYAYHRLFNHNIDEIIISTFTVISFFLLYLGMAENERYLSFLIDTSYKEIIVSISFYFLFISTICPMAFVILGRACVNWASKLSKSMGEELKNTAERFKKQASSVSEPR